jgi:DNA (cytosine-5)-methyltransferase 1
MNLKFVDLCSGIGGFRIALEKLGLECVQSVEIDKDCIKTYNKNFRTKYIPTDIFNLSNKDLKEHDIMCAGFPCQPFSIAGKQKGLMDERGLVINKIIDIAKAQKPKVIFLENVKNLKNHNKGETLKNIIMEIGGVGYDVYYQVLDSSDFGVPQNRPRIYIVAFRKDLNIKEFVFPKGSGVKKPIRDYLVKGDNSIPASKKWDTYIDLYTGIKNLSDIDFPVPKTRQKLERKDKDIDINDCIFQMRSSGIRAISIDRPLPTLAVSVSGGGAMIPIYSKERRHLSLLEIKRIMAFNDNFEFPVSRTSAIKQLANAVCPPVIESIGQSILDKLK